MLLRTETNRLKPRDQDYSQDTRLMLEVDGHKESTHILNNKIDEHKDTIQTSIPFCNFQS